MHLNDYGAIDLERAVLVDAKPDTLEDPIISRQTANITFNVMNRSRSPISGARLLSAAGEEFGCSDQSGAISCPLPAPGQDPRISILATGYQEFTGTIPDGPGSYDVILDSLQDYFGHIERQNIVGSLGGVIVAMWRNGSTLAALSPDDFMSAIHVTTTRSDGSFAFPLSYAEGDSWRCAAIGMGLVSTSSFLLVRGKNNAIPMEYLFGVAVRTSELGGRVIRTDPRAKRTRSGSGSVLPGHGHALKVPNRILSLIGVPYEMISENGRRNWELILASSDLASAHLGPVHMRLSLPGYEEVNRSLDLTPIINSVATLTVELVPTADDWSVLEISFLRSGLDPPAYTPVTSQAIAGQLVFRGLAPISESFSVGLSDLGSGSVTFNGLPRGEYELTFEALHRLYSAVVSPEGSGSCWLDEDLVKVQVDLRHLSSLQFRPILSGAEYSGTLFCRVRKAGSNAGRILPLFPPYRIDALPIGDYHVDAAIRQSDFQDSTRLSSINIRVGPDTMTPIDLPLSSVEDR